jgi:hypothetical protein
MLPAFEMFAWDRIYGVSEPELCWSPVMRETQSNGRNVPLLSRNTPVIIAVILVLVDGTVRLIGNNANSAFSNAASAIH